VVELVEPAEEISRLAAADERGRAVLEAVGLGCRVGREDDADELEVGDVGLLILDEGGELLHLFSDSIVDAAAADVDEHEASLLVEIFVVGEEPQVHVRVRRLLEVIFVREVEDVGLQLARVVHTGVVRGEDSACHDLVAVELVGRGAECELLFGGRSTLVLVQCM
jgi:hypothetical protein